MRQQNGPFVDFLFSGWWPGLAHGPELSELIAWNLVQTELLLK